ncbi:hypothetical protein LCGC14_0822280 [marine sediment metagenome]|uniref:VIT family protein n=1 Tax=marine sediment metagenome TaxID=412755 RepID=A0A0F9SQY8_9ZZZZ
MSKIKSKIKIYNDITNFSEIARRYFINNFYDGALTILGIVLGFLVVILKNSNNIPSIYIILPGLGTSISMFVSGLSGSYLSEKAEQKKGKAKMAMAMAITDEPDEINNEVDILTQKEELEKAMLKTVDLDKKFRKVKKKKKIKTLHDKAESFARIFVAFINGVAPLLGGLIPLIPYFFFPNANLITFFMSFITIFMCIIILGIYIGHISKESIIKHILEMLFAFAITIIIVLLVLG